MIKNKRTRWVILIEWYSAERTIKLTIESTAADENTLVGRIPKPEQIKSNVRNNRFGQAYGMILLHPGRGPPRPWPARGMTGAGPVGSWGENDVWFFHRV